MDFGLFYYCQGRGVPHDQAYAEMLDQITLAERLGFGECWFAEHHFTDYSILPSPNVMIAAAMVLPTPTSSAASSRTGSSRSAVMSGTNW